MTAALEESPAHQNESNDAAIPIRSTRSAAGGQASQRGTGHCSGSRASVGLARSQSVRAGCLSGWADARLGAAARISLAEGKSGTARTRALAAFIPGRDPEFTGHFFSSSPSPPRRLRTGGGPWSRRLAVRILDDSSRRKPWASEGYQGIV